MGHSFYVAGPKQQGHQIISALVEAGHKISYEKLPKEAVSSGDKMHAALASLDIRGMRNARGFICAVPGGVESLPVIGAALAQGKPILVVDICPEGSSYWDAYQFSLMWHPLVTRMKLKPGMGVYDIVREAEVMIEQHEELLEKGASNV